MKCLSSAELIKDGFFYNTFNFRNIFNKIVPMFEKNLLFNIQKIIKDFNKSLFDLVI